MQSCHMTQETWFYSKAQTKTDKNLSPHKNLDYNVHCSILPNSPKGEIT